MKTEKEILEKYEEMLKNTELLMDKVRNPDKYNDVNIEKGILNYSSSVDADLIGMCTHGRTGFSHFFNGSISEDLVNHTVRPVITFKI